MTLKTKNSPYLIGFLLLLYILFAWVNGLHYSFVEFTEIGKHGLKLKDPVLSLSFHFLSLFLNYLIPSEWKHRLIFMRWHHPLPGTRIFSLNKDERVSRHNLIDELGELPTSPDDQNALWYKIYKTKQNDKVVLNSHMRWLLFRDMFAIFIIILFPSIIFTFWNLGVGSKTWTFTLFCLFLLGVIWICARNTGERFANNVIVR